MDHYRLLQRSRHSPELSLLSRQRIRNLGRLSDRQGLVTVPNLNVRALDGSLTGKLSMDFRGLVFRTETTCAAPPGRYAGCGQRSRDFAGEYTALVGRDAGRLGEHLGEKLRTFPTVGHTVWSNPASPATSAMDAIANSDPPGNLATNIPASADVISTTTTRAPPSRSRTVKFPRRACSSIWTAIWAESIPRWK